MKSIKPKARPFQVFLIGENIQKSISPSLHNSLFSRLGLNGQYSLLDFPRGELASSVKRLRTSDDVLGFNITAPYKQKVIRFLSGIDRTSRAIGAVNTVLISRSGKMRGFNTDVNGIEDSLEKLKVLRKAGNALILGAGGAARACAYVLLSRGFRSVVIMNRSQKRAKDLARDFKRLFPHAELKAEPLSEDRFESALPACDLVINAISDESTRGKFPIEVSFNNAKKGLRVLDLGYKRESTLLRSARRSGLESLDGLTMLAGQARKSFEIWTKIPLKRRLVETIARRVIS